MNKALFLSVLLISSTLSFGQAVRFDGIAATTNQANPISGLYYQLLAIPNSIIAICSGSPCTLATTYTSSSGLTSCPLSAQLTRPGSTICYSQSDGSGNFGAWLGAGSYQYTITTPQGTTFGPYSFGVSFSGAFLPLAGGTLQGLVTNNFGFAGPLAGHASLDMSISGGEFTGPVTGTLNNWQNPLSYGTASNQSITTVTATGSNGSGALTISGAGDFVIGSGVMIAHGGGACGSAKSTVCPTGPTPAVVPQGSTGSTTYNYQLACIDGLGGISAAGTAGSTISGNATLAGVVNGTAALTGNYNRVTWTGISSCYEVAIYRNGTLIGSQWSGASGVQTFNDVGLTSWASRDLPSTPPGSALNDNYDGIITTITGISATTSPNLGATITGATMYHDDAPILQAAINVSPFVDIPPGNYILRYPINYTKHTASYAYAGELRGNVNIVCDTGDICIDATGSQNIKFTDLNLQTGASSISLYLSRDTSNGDLAQQIVTDHVSFVTGIEAGNQFSHTFGGRGVVGIYNHAAEIQANLYDQFQADRWMVLTSNNIDNVASVFSVTDDLGANSMSQVDCYSCRGAGYVFGELEDAFTINYDNGYGLGGFLDLRHQWGFEIEGGDDGRFKVNGFRVEGKNGLISVAPGAQFQEPYIWSDLYRVQSPPNALATVPQIYLNTGATLLNAPLIQVDDYGGSGSNFAALVDGVSCAIQNSKLIIGIWETIGSCGDQQLTGSYNIISGFGQGDGALQPSYGITGSQATPTWIKVGTWISTNPPQGDDLSLTFYGGIGFIPAGRNSGIAYAHVRIGNQTAAPNISDAQIYNFGSVVYDQIKVIATGGSTSITNGSWDIYVHQVNQFAGGIYTVAKFNVDGWININATATDPGSASSTIFVGSVNTVQLQGQSASFSSIAVLGTADGCATWASGTLGTTGIACGTGTGSGVTSFAAPSGSWPTWLVPTVTNSTTTPSLAVAASAIPNSALANPATTVNGQTCTLGSTCTVTALSSISPVAITISSFTAAPNSCYGNTGTLNTPSTTAMTGLTTSMAPHWSFATDPRTLVGWGSTGGMVLNLWPTANTVNSEVCNVTASSITTSAVTVNVEP